MYENGNGVTRDYAQAMTWYRKAADLGDPVAMRGIGNLYAKGLGITQDLNEARKWYQKAADKGDQESKDWLNSNPN